MEYDNVNRSKPVCNLLHFHAKLSPLQINFLIDFSVLFRYVVACENPNKFRKEEKNMRKNKTAFLSVVLTAALLVGPAQATEGNIRISSYKGSTLPVEERSGLIIGPSKEAAQTVTSNNTEVVAVENVMGFWVAVTHSEGATVITATDMPPSPCETSQIQPASRIMASGSAR